MLLLLCEGGCFNFFNKLLLYFASALLIHDNKFLAGALKKKID